LKTHNKLLKHRSGAKRRASTGQSSRWSFCAFASLIIAQKAQQFACRLARRYALNNLTFPIADSAFIHLLRRYVCSVLSFQF